jgi:peptidoglycan/LPS O-acetylase OafA/YrhL
MLRGQGDGARSCLSFGHLAHLMHAVRAHASIAVAICHIVVRMRASAHRLHGCDVATALAGVHLQPKHTKNPIMQSSMLPKRFTALDCVRGVAAIAVVLFHYSQLEGEIWLRRGWLAVDVFFCLSGFVIAHSYQHKLEQGMSFVAFARKRLSRLYPLYLFALILGALTFLGTLEEHGAVSMSGIVRALLLGVVALPYLNEMVVSDGEGNIEGALFPLNDPAWSLFFELFVNVLFFLLLAMRFKKFWVLMAVGALGYLVTARWHGLNAGWDTETFIVGFPRVIYSFFAGVLIYRLRDTTVATPVVYGLLAIAVMVTAFVLPPSPWISIACVLVVGPLVIWVNSAVTPGPRLASMGLFLGWISYPLYITHVPVYRMLSILEPDQGWSAPDWLVILASTAVAILAAWGAARLDDAFRALFADRRNKGVPITS